MNINVGKAIDSIFKKPDNIFMKVKVKDILFEGLTIDCRVSDFAGTAVCSEITANYEKLRFKKLEENVFSMSFWGPVRYHLNYYFVCFIVQEL